MSEGEREVSVEEEKDDEWRRKVHRWRKKEREKFGDKTERR